MGTGMHVRRFTLPADAGAGNFFGFRPGCLSGAGQRQPRTRCRYRSGVFTFIGQTSVTFSLHTQASACPTDGGDFLTVHDRVPVESM